MTTTDNKRQQGQQLKQRMTTSDFWCQSKTKGKFGPLTVFTFLIHKRLAAEYTYKSPLTLQKGTNLRE